MLAAQPRASPPFPPSRKRTIITACSVARSDALPLHRTHTRAPLQLVFTRAVPSHARETMGQLGAPAPAMEGLKIHGFHSFATPLPIFYRIRSPIRPATEPYPLSLSICT